MKRTAYSVQRTAFAFLLFAICYSPFANADETVVATSKELIENAKEFDGKTVVYAGELISGVLKRGVFSWANLHDGSNALGVWCRTRDLAVVKFAGGYDSTGDVIGVEGVFNRACPEHLGEMDIHALKVSVIKEGVVREENINKRRAVFSVVVFSILLLMIMSFRNRF